MLELSATLTRCRGRLHADVRYALVSLLIVVVVMAVVGALLLLNYLTLD